MRRTRTGLHYFMTVAALLIVWQAYVTLFHITDYILPGPYLVWQAFEQLAATGQLWPNLFQTLLEIVSGYAIGTLGGFGLGVLLARSKALAAFLSDLLLFVQTAPKIALAPLFVLWFGLGFASKLVLVVSLVFFPVLVATMLGLRSVPEEYRQLGRLLRLDPSRALLRLELPLALPDIFGGLKIGLVQAVIGAIVAEWMAGNRGLGYLMSLGDTTFQTGILLAAIVLTVIVGVAFNGLIDWTEGRVLYWHQSQRAGAEL